MKKVITYGTYDLLHYGHINLLERAKGLGDYLIVGVTSDLYDRERGKLNVSQSLTERIEAIKNSGLADQIIVEEYDGQKIDDIKKYDVDIFAIGSDWVGRFDYLNEYCNVIYLPRTEGVSSTQLRNQNHKRINIAIVGSGYTSVKFMDEAQAVGAIKVTGCYDKEPGKAGLFAKKYRIKNYGSLEEMLSQVDAAYIGGAVEEHFPVIRKAIRHNCHVLCHTPMFLNQKQADICYQEAEQKGVILFEGIKTLYFPAFTHLLLLVNTGVIGEVKDISVSCSIERKKEIIDNKYAGSMYSWANIVLLPIIKILGTNILDKHLFDYAEDTYSKFTNGFLQYKGCTANFKVGKNLKTEGSLIITGTKGYIYVPAPWWKTDYFEIRYEDLRDTRKYFYKYDGEGYRYMLWDFVHIINGEKGQSKLTKEEQYCMVEILDGYGKGRYEKIL